MFGVNWRLHDVLTNLTRKHDKQEKQYRDDNQTLTSDFKHQLDQFRDVQKKAQSVLFISLMKFSLLQYQFCHTMLR